MGTADVVIFHLSKTNTEVTMLKNKMRAFLLLILLATLPATSLAQEARTQRASETTTLTGTWSGNWTPKGGTPDAITVELRQEAGGKLTGKFLTPQPMEFTKASFNAATGVVMFEATDGKSKSYKVEGKVKGTELIGTLAVSDTAGEVRLIKWTFFGR
jgi:hypothetical protein